MAANVYNIIWADDDIDSFRYDKLSMDALKRNHIYLLDYAKTSTELREKLIEWEDQVDAVITDGNFDRVKRTDVNKSTSGLNDVLSFINEFNRKRIIPFYLYTGKKALIKDKFPDGELDYFEKRDRIFEKSSFKQLLERIVSDVDHINSPQFRIRNKYSKEFEAAKDIDEAVSNLERGLLYVYDESSWSNTQDYFNPARKIVERIFRSCANLNLLPPHLSLNVASRVLSGVDCGYSLKVNLMEKPLSESLHYFLKITQDGSHDEDDLSLNVDQYVRDTKNINLYRTILYITMDLLLWHKRIKERYRENKERLWNSSFIYENKVCLHSSGKFYYTGKYQLDTKGVEINDGDWVGILKSDPNKYKTGEITEYVFKSNYIILEHTEKNKE